MRGPSPPKQKPTRRRWRRPVTPGVHLSWRSMDSEGHYLNHRSAVARAVRWRNTWPSPLPHWLLLGDSHIAGTSVTQTHGQGITLHKGEEVVSCTRRLSYDCRPTDNDHYVGVTCRLGLILPGSAFGNIRIALCTFIRVDVALQFVVTIPLFVLVLSFQFPFSSLSARVFPWEDFTYTFLAPV